jgi:CheY-like chemotaxis protein
MSDEQKPKILVVDDLFDARMLMRFTLERSGWEVLDAGNAEAAIQATFQLLPDLVLMDFNMPDMHGIAACRVIKENPRTAHIPVIIYTGAPSPETKRMAIEAGASEFLAKPILPAMLRKIVQTIYEQSKTS